MFLNKRSSINVSLLTKNSKSIPVNFVLSRKRKAIIIKVCMIITSHVTAARNA
jgi:hypothetical protein